MEIISICIYMVLLIGLLDYISKPKQSNVIPYRIPIIGHILLFLGKKSVHLTLTDLAERYGPIYTLQIFNKHVVVLNGYEAIFSGLVTNGYELGGRIKTFRINYVLGGNDLVFQDISPKWQRLKNLVHTHLSPRGEKLLHMNKIVLDIAQEFIDGIKSKCVLNPELDLSDDVYLAVTNTISSLFSGQKYHRNDPILKKWITAAKFGEKYVGSMNNGLELDLFPWLRYFGSKTFNRINEYISMTEELFLLIKETSFINTDETSMGIAQALVNDLKNEKNIPENQVIDEDTIRLVIVDLMGAALLSTASVMNAFFKIMAAYPQVQKKLHDEIISITQTHRCSEISMNFRDEMPYTVALIYELLRYVTPAPFGSPHVAITNCDVQGTHISKGTIVINNFWQLHHDDRYWDDPWEFKPERFLDADGELLPSNHILRKRLMVFSAGPRACVGQSLALARMFLFISNLIAELEIQSIEHVEGNKYSDLALHDPRNYEFHGIVTPKKSRIKFIIRERAVF